MVHDQGEMRPEAQVQPHEWNQVVEEESHEEFDLLQPLRMSTSIKKDPSKD